MKKFAFLAASATMIVAMIVSWALVSRSAAQNPPPPLAKQANGSWKLYNTAKQKLLDGKQVFSFTQSKADPAAYCETAKHYDFTWFEMQHSTLEFRDVEAMIAACPTSPPRP